MTHFVNNVDIKQERLFSAVVENSDIKQEPLFSVVGENSGQNSGTKDG